MKNSLTLNFGLVALFFWVGQERVQAQLLQPPPVNSTGIGGFRPGTTGLLGPQYQLQGSLLALQNQQINLMKEVKKIESSGGSGPGTGRVSGFNTHKKYFANNGKIASGNRSSSTIPRLNNAANSNSTSRQNENNGPSTPVSPFRRY
jgi:hypothetical protein